MIGASKMIYINSEYRSAGTNENFRYDLILTEQERKYTHCVVTSCSIPMSYYLIQEEYNMFQLEEDGKTVDLVVDPGNYSTISFMIVIMKLLNDNSPNGYTYNMYMNNKQEKNDGKIYYEVSGNGLIQPSIKPNSMFEQFGFIKDSTNIFNSNKMISTNVVNFIPEQTLYIMSDIIANDSVNGGVLQQIFTSNTTPYSCSVYQCTALEGSAKKIVSNIHNSVSIILKNESDQVMNLNGRNMLISILLFEKLDIYDLFKKFLHYSYLKNEEK